MPVTVELRRRFILCAMLFPSCALTEVSNPTAAPGNMPPEEYVKLAEEAFEKSDIVSAMNHYRKAAEAGHAPAMSRLGYLLDKSEADEEAVQWFTKAVEMGNAEAQFELARMYAYGEGIEQDKKVALKLFEESANNNYAPAIRVLATAYEQGGLDLRIDYETAQQWLERGLLIHDYWSIKRLAEAYKKGDLGLRIDRVKARKLEDQLEPLLEQNRR